MATSRDSPLSAICHFPSRLKARMTVGKPPNGWTLARVIEELAPEDLVQRLREAEIQVKAAKAIATRSARDNWITGSISVLYEQAGDRGRLAGSIEHRDQILARVLAPIKSKLVSEEWSSDARIDDPEADQKPILAAAWPYIEITDWANSQGLKRQGRARIYFDIRITETKLRRASETPQSPQGREALFSEFLAGERRADRRKPKSEFERIARQEYGLMKKTFEAIWAEHGWRDPGRIAEKTPPENPI